MLVKEHCVLQLLVQTDYVEMCSIITILIFVFTQCVKKSSLRRKHKMHNFNDISIILKILVLVEMNNDVRNEL